MENEKQKKRGRPSKKDTIDMDQMKQLYLAGWDDNQVSDFFDINQDTLNEWKKKDNIFSEALKNWKHVADHKVERSLYERACGYSHREEKIFQYEGTIVRAETIKQYAPDTIACIFWLKNRQPEQWRDVISHQHNGNVTVEMLHKKVTEYAEPVRLDNTSRSICIN